MQTQAGRLSTLGAVALAHLRDNLINLELPPIAQAMPHHTPPTSHA